MARLIDADDMLAEYTEQDIFRSAIDTYGEVMQITVAFEEMSELQKELCKHLRGSGSQERDRRRGDHDGTNENDF